MIMKSLQAITTIHLFAIVTVFGNTAFNDLVYDSSKSYEIDDAVIISTTNPTLYTAKIAVPAGDNSPPNTTYWLTAEEKSTQLESTYSETTKTVPSTDNINTDEITGLGNPPDLASTWSTRLTGISTRGTISKDKAMTGGILIEGTENKKVVFMAKGYSMFVSDNVQNYADDLVMQILSYNSSTSSWDDQGTFDDWGSVQTSTTTSGATVENVSTIDSSKNPEITLLQGAKETCGRSNRNLDQTI